MPSYGQGPSMQALAQQQHMSSFTPPQAQKSTNLFIGSISPGITDAFLNQILSVRLFTSSLSTRSLTVALGTGMRLYKSFQAPDHSRE